MTMNSVVLARGRGACRAAGNNFLAEAVGILYALHLCPSGAPLYIGSDSRAAIGATNKHRIRDWLRSKHGEYTNEYAIPQRARAVSAARPVLNMIREMIRLRRGTVTFGHVRAHTQGRDFESQMNDIADHEANLARLEWAGRARELGTWLTGEDRFRLRVGGFPVVGSYRDAIKRQMRERRFIKWAGGGPPGNPEYGFTGGAHEHVAPGAPDIQRISPKAGLGMFPANMHPLQDCGGHYQQLIRSNPVGMKGLAKVVRKARDPLMRRFYLPAVCEWTPVERRLTKTGRDGRRGDGCKRCGDYRETLRHVYACDALVTRTIRTNCTRKCLDLLHEAGVETRRSVSRPNPPARTQGGMVCWVRVWFDLSDSSWMRVWMKREPLMHGSPRDRLGDVLGVLPTDTSDYLDSVWDGEIWRRRELGTVQELLGKIRAELMEAALRTYVDRCTDMTQWWRSPEAGRHRAARARDLAVRRKRTAEDRETADQRRYAQTRAAKAMARKSKQPKQTRVPDGIASRVSTRTRKQTDYGPFISTKSVDEYMAEAAQDCRTSTRRAPDLPWF